VDEPCGTCQGEEWGCPVCEGFLNPGPLELGVEWIAQTPEMVQKSEEYDGEMDFESDFGSEDEEEEEDADGGYGRDTPRHTGTLTCVCAHNVIGAQWPLDHRMFHLRECCWSCCGESWRSTNPCPEVNEDEDEDAAEEEEKEEGEEDQEAVVSAEDMLAARLMCEIGDIEGFTAYLARPGGERSIMHKFTDGVAEASGRNTFMQFACVNGHLPIAMLLHERNPGALAQKNNSGLSACTIACSTERDKEERVLACVRHFFDSTPDLLAERDETTGASCLHLSASAGNTAIARYLVSKDPTLAESSDYSSNTPLHLCAAEGHLECVQFLVGAAPHTALAKNDFSQEPLQMAMDRNQEAVVMYLLENM